MIYGNLENDEIAKVIYEPLENNDVYDNASGFMLIRFMEIYNEKRIGEFLDNLVLEIKDDYNGMLYLFDKQNENNIELNTLYNYGFNIADENDSNELLIYDFDEVDLLPKFKED